MSDYNYFIHRSSHYEFMHLLVDFKIAAQLSPLTVTFHAFLTYPELFKFALSDTDRRKLSRHAFNAGHGLEKIF
jgi:hypothetical protein